MPFRESGADDALSDARAKGSLFATIDPAEVAGSTCVIVVIGTPVSDTLQPDPMAIPNALAPFLGHIQGSQTLILRSTVYPGVTRMVENLLLDHGLPPRVAFCPERIAEGQALTELFSLPQIIASRSMEARDDAVALFSILTEKILFLEPEEAELAKLMTNAWRYVKFATANQFFMMANDFGLDYERIRRAITWEYPRAADLPAAGFAAGPCLFKDTMQLAAFSTDSFDLGNAAMTINEGLPRYLVSHLRTRYSLSSATVGILGMAFKGDSDDTRQSLSYVLKRLLIGEGAQTLCTDPFVTGDPELVSLDRVLAESDLMVIGAPHTAYRGLNPHQPLVDIWNLTDRGARI